MLKSDLRKKYKELRNTLSENDIDDLSIAIANQCLHLPIWDKTYFHIFLPIQSKKEVNTEFLLHILQGKDKEVIISKSDFTSGEMQNILLTENTKIKENAYGIPEPESGLIVPENYIEVVFIPLLAFDVHAHRIGYGKGFYDKFLSKCNSNTIKIGLSFFEAEPIIQNPEPTDIKLNYCVTPTKIYTF
jgi:5-formyltetrahydrofolate cyclo-ligase